MSNKILSYSDSIGETIKINMRRNKKIFVAGLEVDYSSKVFGSVNIPLKYYPKRFIQTPAMENGLCAILAGAAISGLKPIFVNNRCDFLLLAFDTIVNIIDKWNYMFDGNSGKCPIVITAVIGRGWGQGATHSQSFHNFFSRLTGIDVFLPTFPRDVKNIYNYSLKSKRPSIILQHRTLFSLKENYLKKKKFTHGKANIVKKGQDLAIISLSYGIIQSLRVHKIIKDFYRREISVLDLVSINPLDKKSILNLSKSHKNIIILDIDHTFSGIATEISSLILENFKNKNICKIGNLQTPAPVAETLEKIFYPSDQLILDKCCNLLKLKKIKNLKEYNYKKNSYKFNGPY